MLLPLPLGPTRATVVPAATDRFSLANTVTSGRWGYENPTSRSSRLPVRALGRSPAAHHPCTA